MSFRQHPQYVRSDRRDWLPLPAADAAALPAEAQSPALLETVLARRETLCALALARISRHAGDDYLAARPRPEVNELLYQPSGEHGFRAYIEYFFFAAQDDDVADGDYWWAIVHCPHALPADANDDGLQVTDFGWSVA